MINAPAHPYPYATPTEVRGFDLIGDVHGCGLTLVRLLEALGYRQQQGVYCHPERQAIFLGDIVDRGPRVREALATVRAMVERGSAQMILGNHELNSLAYCTPRTPGGRDYLRVHSPSNNRQIAETLQQFSAYPKEWQSHLEWFATLPLFLELRHPNGQVFRAVHACWDQPLIDSHRAFYGGNGINAHFLAGSVEPGSLAYRARQRLTTGVEFALPEGVEMVSEDGYRRRGFRSKFWDDNAQTYGDLSFQPDPLPEQVAAAPISRDHRQQMVIYQSHEPPLFVGHYWLKGRPALLTHNIACLDYSAVKMGHLVAYRMDGEAQLNPDKFVWVDVVA